ncbi:MAG TPA: DUF5985 family protein [Candidatus Thermoplasmatota archaeon]|nr:DUF5985 family protein [Candidatus Thermoplasmatota archaeon]
MAIDLTLPATVAGVVAILCAVVAVAAWRAMVRTGNRGITLVSLAFALLALKGGLKAWNLAFRGPESPTIELVFSLVDLTAVGLIAWPILRSRG